jgi:hypothetical protein
MNIQQLESILEEMRSTQFQDLREAHACIERWCERLDDAVAAELTRRIQYSMGALQAVG